MFLKTFNFEKIFYLKWNKTCSDVRSFFIAPELKNRDFSLFTNDCVGGVILHKLKMPFNSPTINLYFPDLHEFVKYVRFLRDYVALEPEEVTDSGLEFPVGMLRSPEHGNVQICFMHYHSFAEAREKWLVRSRRVRQEKAYALLQLSYPDRTLVEEFGALPNAKALITYPGIYTQIGDLAKKQNIPCCILKTLEHGRNGEALGYSGWFGRRHIDEFDSVDFFNNH